MNAEMGPSKGEEVVFGAGANPNLKRQMESVDQWADYSKLAGGWGSDFGVRYGMGLPLETDAAARFNRGVNAMIDTVAAGYRKLKARVMARVRPQRPL